MKKEQFQIILTLQTNIMNDWSIDDGSKMIENKEKFF